MASTDGSFSIIVMKPQPIQPADQDSFVGGQPKIPTNEKLPICENCRATQTFFFQIAFPANHSWAGQTLAVFECTACRDDANPVPAVNKILVPFMKNMDLKRGEDVPDGALDLVQKTCRFLVFDTEDGTVRPDYETRVGYRPIVLQQSIPETKATSKSKLGGEPGWVEVRLTPGKYLGEPLQFLMQWKHHYQFDRVPESPPPYNPFQDTLPGLTDEVMHYLLFHGTQLYFFGNRAGGFSHIYMIPIRTH